jgi:hypothetical protein
MREASVRCFKPAILGLVKAHFNRSQAIQAKRPAIPPDARGVKAALNA